MIDFSKSDEQLINTFGEYISINGVPVRAIFDELPSQYDRSEDAEYKATIYEGTSPTVLRGDVAEVRGRKYYVRSVQPMNGILEVILNI